MIRHPDKYYILGTYVFVGRTFIYNEWKTLFEQYLKKPNKSMEALLETKYHPNNVQKNNIHIHPNYSEPRHQTDRQKSKMPFHDLALLRMDRDIDRQSDNICFPPEFYREERPEYALTVAHGKHEQKRTGVSGKGDLPIQIVHQKISTGKSLSFLIETARSTRTGICKVSL